MAYQELVTKNRYPLDEVTSAMQKAIRRADEEDAAYWAYELFVSGYWKHMWKRLLVISCEDIGDPAVIGLVNGLFVAFEFIQKTSKTDHHWNQAAFAIRAMSRAKKTRAANSFACYIMELHADNEETGERRPIPDRALDKHTKRGRAMGRGMEHFFSEASRIEPESGEEDEYLPGLKLLIEQRNGRKKKGGRERFRQAALGISDD